MTQAAARKTPDTPPLDVPSSTPASRLRGVSRQSRTATPSSPVDTGKEFKRMNALARLILQRKEELDLTWDDIADRGGFSSHTVVYSLANKQILKQPPRLETLERIAKALVLPLDVVKMAAVEASGLGPQEVTVTLSAAKDLRIIAASMDEMSERDRKKLRQIAEAFANEAREAGEG